MIDVGVLIIFVAMGTALGIALTRCWDAYWSENAYNARKYHMRKKEDSEKIPQHRFGSGPPLG